MIGPLPRTPRGNQNILTVVDHFTKHVEAYALPDQEATTIARVFLNEFVSRYGVSYVIHTDQGSNFESNFLRNFAKFSILLKRELALIILNVMVKWNVCIELLSNF